MTVWWAGKVIQAWEQRDFFLLALTLNLLVSSEFRQTPAGLVAARPSGSSSCMKRADWLGDGIGGLLLVFAELMWGVAVVREPNRIL